MSGHAQCRRRPGNANVPALGLGGMTSSLRLTLAAVAAAVLPACTSPQDISVNYPRPAPVGEPTGTIDVSLTTADGNMTVTVNDAMVVERKYSRKAHIANVPAGPAVLHVALGGNCVKAREYTRELDVTPGQTVEVALPGAEVNDGCAVYQGLLLVAEVLELVAAATVLAVVGSSSAAHH